MNITRNIRTYLGERVADHRYSSFDYCFQYFQSFRQKGQLAELLDSKHVQLSCLQLGFYLASWGMFRGSAELLQKSARYLEPLIAEVAATDEAIWAIDLDDYSRDNIQALRDTANKLKQALNGRMSDTLATKIMLGVFGNVPAFDENFKRGAKVSTFGPKALKKLSAFYTENHELIDGERARSRCLDFLTGDTVGPIYPRAKIADMIFFVEGMSAKAGNTS